MFVDAHIPSKIHIVGGHTTSATKSYFLNDAWTLDLVDLTWRPMEFDHETPLNDRISSLSSPLLFHNDAVLFCGKTVGYMVPGKLICLTTGGVSEQLTRITRPSPSIELYLEHHNPFALKYYNLYNDKESADVQIEIGDANIVLHRAIIMARASNLFSFIPAKYPLESQYTARSSQNKLCAISLAEWEEFMAQTLPSDYNTRFRQTFDPALLQVAFQYLYTDTLMDGHYYDLNQCVQLFAMSLCFGLYHLSITSLIHICEHLGPWNVQMDHPKLLAEMIELSDHFKIEESLNIAFKWHYAHAVRELTGSDHSVTQWKLSAENLVNLRPVFAVSNFALDWASSHTLAKDMDAFLNSSRFREESDFELVVPVCNEYSLTPAITEDEDSETMYGRFIPVHKCIVGAMSPFLKTLMSSQNFKESRQNYAIIHNLPYNMDRHSLQAFVCFMYSGTTSHITEKSIALDILCNIDYFFARESSSEPCVIHSLQKPGSLEDSLTNHCLGVILSGEITDDFIRSLKELAESLKLNVLQHHLSNL
jgi:hypothetical protein